MQYVEYQGDEMNRKRSLAGIDGINFEMCISVSGLESVNISEEIKKNSEGNIQMSCRVFGGKLLLFVNLPCLVRNDNTQPFQISEAIKLEVLKMQAVNFIQQYLKNGLKEKYSDELLNRLQITKIECNLTLQTFGKCQPKHVIRLFEESFAKVTIYKETQNGKTIRKPEIGMTTTKPHEWVLKVYDKSYQQRKDGNIKVASNLLRIEFVFIDRTLKRLFGKDRGIYSIFSKKSVFKIIEEFQRAFSEVIENNIKPALSAAKFEIVADLDNGMKLQEVLLKEKEIIYDIEILREALKHEWEKKNQFKKNPEPDHTKQTIYYYKKPEFGIPQDVLKTLIMFHEKA